MTTRTRRHHYCVNLAYGNPVNRANNGLKRDVAADVSCSSYVNQNCRVRAVRPRIRFAIRSTVNGQRSTV
eukprot:6807886-Pyramimonas_sp.AAC.1